MVDQTFESRTVKPSRGAADSAPDGAGAEGPDGLGGLGALGAEAVAMVGRWLGEASGARVGDASGAGVGDASGAAVGDASGASGASIGVADAAADADADADAARLAFAAAFIDGVVRPEDSAVAARNLERLAASAPEQLPPRLRSAIRIGGTVGEALPWAVVPTSRRVLRRMLGRLIVDATPSKLGDAIARLSADGSRPTLQLLGDPVLGDAGARRRIAAIGALIARDDVASVAIPLSSVGADLSLWDFDETVGRVAESLVPLYELARSRSVPPAPEATPAASGARDGAGDAASATGKRIGDAASGARSTLITLDADVYRNFDLTIAVFQNVLSRPGFGGLEAGITLQADLPDALSALQRLQEWARSRVAAGGAPITVRLVRSGDRAREQLEATTKGWPLATFSAPGDVDRNLARLLDWALTPERTDAVRIILAGDDLFDIAFAAVLAVRRGLLEAEPAEPAGPADAPDAGASSGAAVEPETTGPTRDARFAVELPPGADAARADVVRRQLGGVFLRTPVVHPRELAAASPYLLRLLAQKAGDPDALSIASALASPDALKRRGTRFLASLDGLAPSWPEREAFAVMDSILDSDEAVLDARPPRPNRLQDRSLVSELVPAGASGFANVPDTDPSLPANREWARRILDRAAHSRLGIDTLSAARQRDALLAEAAAAPPATDPAATDPASTDPAATDSRVAALGALVAATAEAGGRWGAQPLTERAAHLRRAALSLDANRDRLVEVMVSESGAPIATADTEASAAVDFAALYAGLALELERVDGARHVPPALVVVFPTGDAPITSPAAGVLQALAAGAAVILKPAPEARRASAVLVEALWESGVPRDVLVLVDLDERDATADTADTDTADTDTTAIDAGWHHLLHSLVVDPRVDHVTLHGFWEAAERLRAWRPDLSLFAHTGGRSSIIVTPSADLDLAAADIAGSSIAESSIAESDVNGTAPQVPALVILVGSVEKSTRFDRQLADALPVRPEIRHVPSLDEAIALQNNTPFGAPAGLQSLDPTEVEHWLAKVEAGDLFLNRPLTTVVVGRQPVGGWKRSSVGPGTKTGGPNALLPVGHWVNEPDTENETEPQTEPRAQAPALGLAGLDARVQHLIESATAGLDWRQFDFVRRGALSDDQAFRSVFAARDLNEAPRGSSPSGERNVLRYRPVPVVIRLSENEPFEDLVRVLAAGTRARASLGLSTALKLPRPLRALLKERRVRVFVENDAAWLERAAKVGDGSSRIRMIGGDPRALAEAVGGSPDVAVYSGPVTRAGRLELMPFLVEQTVSVTHHRFGAPGPLKDLRIE